MKNNCAILNCFTKQLFFKFEDKFFTVDLTEGDLEDSWNGIAFSENTSLDFNFSWQEGTEPCATLYEIYQNEDGTWSTDFFKSYSLSIVNVFGTYADYFNEEFNANKGNISYKVYVGSNLVKRTKSLNTASDMSVNLTMLEKKEDVHVIAVDRSGATKIISAEKKHIDSANIKLNQTK